MLNKRIVLGISGGIAAYKSAELTRLLIKAGAEVRVCMTASAQEFVTPLTFQSLSGQTVHTDLLDPAAEAAMGHIELAKWADLIIIAPATANLLAKLAFGHADDLLTTCVLATAAPIVIAPAMNQQMWKQSAVQANAKRCRQHGYSLLGPAAGEQACGDTGYGRMVEPEVIVQALNQFFSHAKSSQDSSQTVVAIDQADSAKITDSKSALNGRSSKKLNGCKAESEKTGIDTTILAGKKILITAGPTREAIDPVRYISNHSSGKMGFAIAEAAAQMGAKVTLIAGPVALETPAKVERIDVTTAEQMMAQAREQASHHNCFIATAAVADYRPATIHNQKMKKSQETMEMNLVKNPDILATISHEFPDIFTLGFAAETENLAKNATDKLKRKSLDMIAVNSVANGKAFGQTTNALTVFWEGGFVDFPEMSKFALAQKLLELLAQKSQQSVETPKANDHPSIQNS